MTMVHDLVIVVAVIHGVERSLNNASWVKRRDKTETVLHYVVLVIFAHTKNRVSTYLRAIKHEASVVFKIAYNRGSDLIVLLIVPMHVLAFISRAS